MHILFFCNLRPVKSGAFEAFLMALGHHLRARGNRMTLVCAAEPAAPVAEALRSANVAWTTLRKWDTGERVGAWRFCVPALRILKQVRPDVAVVHYGNELPSVVVATLSRMPGIRTPAWCWQQDQQICAPSRMTRHMSRIRLVSLVFDRLVAVYEGGRESMEARGVPRDKIELVYNGVAEYAGPQPPVPLRRELKLADSTVVVMAVGSLIPRKRMDVLLRAVALLDSRDRSRARVLLVGDGPERQNLEDLAVQLGVAESVMFLGARDDVREMLGESDVFALPSAGEACSFAVLEAMAAGCPVVMTDTGAAREQVEHGTSGFVVPPGDAKRLAAGLTELVRDRELRRSFGRHARQRWAARHRLDTMVRGYSAIYEKMNRGQRAETSGAGQGASQPGSSGGGPP